MPVPDKVLVPNPPVSATLANGARVERVVEITADHGRDPRDRAADAGGRSVGPVPEVDGHRAGIRRVVERAGPAALDIADELRRAAEDEGIGARVAHQASGRTADAGAQDVERIGDPLGIDVAGHGGTGETDRCRPRPSAAPYCTVVSLIVNTSVLRARLTVDGDRSAGADERELPPPGIDPTGLPPKVTFNSVLPLFGVTTY